MERPNKRARTDASPEPMDVDEARKENDLRLESRFQDIFEKYGRDFGPVGDEIDLKTGEIVINNGHLQEMENEQDVSRGMWDEFHPEDDVEHEESAASGVNGVGFSSDIKPDVNNTVSGGVLYGGFANRKDDYGAPHGNTIFPVSPDQGASTHAFHHASMSSPSFERPIRPPSAHTTGAAASAKLQSSPAQGSTPGYHRVSLEPLRNPPEINEANLGSGAASKPATPAPIRSSVHRSPSPPGSGSVWAVPGMVRRRAPKKKLQQQSKATSGGRARNVSRDSPDSDDPLNDGSKLTPSKMTPTINDFNRKAPPIAANSTNRNSAEQGVHNDGSNDVHDGQIREFILPNSPDGTLCETHVATEPENAINDRDRPLAGTPSQQKVLPGTVEQDTRNDATYREATFDMPPGPLPDSTPHKTFDNTDVVPGATPVTETPLRDGLTDVSGSLRPQDIENIVEQRTIQRMPWQKIFESPDTPRPNQRQLKQLYQARKNQRATLSERSQSWNSQEREKIESFQPTAESTWGEMQSLLPSKNIEEIQTEWIRTCYSRATAARVRNTESPNNAEIVKDSQQPVTPTGNLRQNNHTPLFPTSRTGSDLTTNAKHTPHLSGRRAENPDPLSAALEESQAGTGLSTLEVDTPPDTARKKASRYSLKEPVSPLAKRSSRKS